MNIGKINKIIHTLLDNAWDFTDETAEKMLGGEYIKIYKKQRGAIITAFKEFLPIKKKLDDLEWHNQHSEYMLEVARFCKDKNYIKIFEHICGLHELDGRLLPCLSDYRNLQWECLKNEYAEKLQPLGIYPLIEEEFPF